MPEEIPAAIDAADATQTGGEVMTKVNEPKGPPIPATPPAITAAVDAFEAAVRAWWKNPDDDATVAPVGAAITALMLAREEPYLDPVPLSVRTHFARFRSANAIIVREATAAGLRTLIPWTAEAVPLSHLTVVTKPPEGAD